MWFKNKSSRHDGPPQSAPDLVLYYFPQCPYCVRVLRALEKLHLELELRHTREDPGRREELIEGGGRSMVPCLRMKKEDGTVQWMYESLDIVAYLEHRFSSPPQKEQSNA